MLVKGKVCSVIPAEAFLWTSAVTVWINLPPLIYQPSALFPLTPTLEDISIEGQRDF